VRHRQARLKSKYWSSYPKIQSGIWHQASSLVGSVLYLHKGRPTVASLTGRPLPEEHFDFRFGDPPRRASELGVRTRLYDPPPLA
jgi:hypothetical protein